MPDRDLDETDRRIIQCLQGDARNVTTAEIGEQLGVSGSTVANRISRLEESGVIEGYAPIVDYERSGFGEHHLFVGTLPDANEDEVLAALPEQQGVVRVTGLLPDEDDVLVEAVAEDQAGVERVAESLSELDIAIQRTAVVTESISRTYDGFGTGTDTEG